VLEKDAARITKAADKRQRISTKVPRISTTSTEPPFKKRQLDSFKTNAWA
jgi:hypothetical protein